MGYSHVYFFSDLHLVTDHEPMARRFQVALREIAAMSRSESGSIAVILGGDIFNLRIGVYGKDDFPMTDQAIRSLRQSQVSVFYCQGNHDFHLSPWLLPLGIVVRDQIDLFLADGRRVYAAHGDLVNRSDVLYLMMRAVLRSPLFRLLSYRLPIPAFRFLEKMLSRGLDQQARDVSRMQALQTTIRPWFRAFVQKKWRQRFDLVLLGHCHDLDEWAMGSKRYMNTGYPKVHGHFIGAHAFLADLKRHRF